MVNYDEVNSIRSGAMSTDDIFRGDDVDRSLTSDLNTMESNITTLQTGKADINHTHTNYMSEEDDCWLQNLQQADYPGVFR